MRDLSSARWMWIKAVLFLVIGVVSCALIVADNPSLRVVVLLALAVWSFCRAYYFAFYVIEKYIDPAYRFSGLISALRYLWKNRRKL
jgi:uncharacterized membrane protein